MKFLAWVEMLPISQWVVNSDWGYPILLCAHSIGLALVVGVLLVLGLRVLGYAKSIPLSAFDTLFKFAYAGFILNGGSGVLLFMANPRNLITNWTFLLKIALIVVGSIAAFYLWRMAREDSGRLPATVAYSKPTKILAGFTMASWLGAIVSGRYIAYTLAAALEATYK